MIGKYRIVALCISRIQENFSHDFIITFGEVLKQAGYRLFVYNACSDLENDESQNAGQKYTYDLIDYNVIDALVVYEDRIRNRRISESIIQKGLENKVPVVVLGDAHPGCISISSNDPLGMEKMVRHLVSEHGVRNLHFVAGTKDEPYSDARIAAFKKVLAESDIPYDDSMLSYGDYWAGPTEAAVIRLIEENKLPEAFVCVNDHTALSVCGVLKNYGIRIPEDVRVTGYDGLFDVKMASPTVTTVSCSQGVYAEHALRAIESIFDGSWEEKDIKFEPELWLFESCGCGRQHTINAAEYIVSLKDSIYRFHADNQELTELMAELKQSEDAYGLSKVMRHPLTGEVCCVIEKKFLDVENSLTEAAVIPDSECVLLYDGFADENFVPHDYDKAEIVPALDQFLEEGRVVIFSALSYLNIPMGYICFAPRRLITSELLRTPQTSSFVGMGIGGYVNLRHDQYLGKRIEEMYRVDSLTGLYNRRGFAIKYQELAAAESNEKLTVMLADVDDLKGVNDKHGHAAGDIAICTVADALRYVCPEGTLAVRFGGDEMLAVCLGELDVAAVSERFYRYLDMVNSKAKRDYEVKASIGIYITGSGERPGFEELVTQSDRLMYAEKTKRKAK